METPHDTSDNEPLTAGEFREFFRMYQKDSTAVQTRLDSIERMLWQGEKLKQLEERQRELAMRSGFPDLAIPLSPPLGQN